MASALTTEGRLESLAMEANTLLDASGASDPAKLRTASRLIDALMSSRVSAFSFLRGKIIFRK